MGLKKEMIQSRVNLLEDIVHELHVSKNGNWWGVPYYESINQTRKITMNQFSLRKGNFFKEFGIYKDIPIQNTILMVTKTGVLKAKEFGSKNFCTIGRKFFTKKWVSIDSIENLNKWSSRYEKKYNEAPLKDKDYEYYFRKWFYKGRKNEWTLDRPVCDSFEFFRSFKSLKEARVFLGYEFISDNEFYEYLSNKNLLNLLFYAAVLEKSDRVALIKHVKKNRIGLLNDIYQLLIQSREEGAEIENFRISSNKEKLRKTHHELTLLFNSAKVLAFSDEKIYYKSPLFNEFKKLNLKFKVIDSPRELYLTGCKSRHCIATRSGSMGTDLFISFFWEEEYYDCQFKGQKIYEFKGYQDKNRPEELFLKVNAAIASVVSKDKPIKLWVSSNKKESLESLGYSEEKESATRSEMAQVVQVVHEGYPF